ncbi:28S ribosomal protein S27, mitochondrial [Halotydeus destructor]|nr:28S ribosomal protein S27, mitochondrial [Halotydeus destructor]
MSLISSHRHFSLKLWSRCCQIRTFLSSSYACDDAWKLRLNQPLLKNVKPDSFFTEISQRYAKKYKVGAVDIDLFAHVVTRAEQLDELEHLLLKLRKTRRSADTLESTHHAVCKAYIALDATDRLLKLLLNRIGYGIFPDAVCYNILLDHYIVEKDFLSAAKVASLVMQQEDANNQITNRLALYAVYKYVIDAEKQPWSDQTDESAQPAAAEDDEDEEDVQYIRVPRLRNPYHDDHFDITNGDHMCGKTLRFFGKQFDDVAGRSCQLLGLALHEKWNNASDLVATMNKGSGSEKLFSKNSTEKIRELVNALGDDYEEKQAAVNLVSMLDKVSGRVSEDQLETLLHEKLSALPQLETKDIEELRSKFVDFDKKREVAVKAQLRELLRDERIKEINAKRRELDEREKLLFFFENYSKHEMDFANAQERMKDLKLQSHIEEEYIPPKVRN